MPSPKVQFGFARSATRLDEYLDWVKVADAVDPDLLSFGDGQDLWNEVYVTLTATAMRTRRARIGPNVTNPITRHPAVTAGAIASINQLSGGRAFLGIATGLSALRNIGKHAAKVQELEEYVRAVQDLTAGRPATWQGQQMKLNWGPQRVPVLVGARGANALRMAGRVADGVIVGGGVTTPEVIKTLQGQIEVGAKEAGRSLKDLEIWWLTRIVLAPSEEEGIDMMRDYLAGYAAHGFRGPAILAEAPPEVQEKIHIMEKGYNWSEHLRNEPGPEGISNNAALLEKQGIKRWLANRFVITGPPDHCISKLRALVGAGATNIIVPQVLPNPVLTARGIGEKLFPAFR